MIKKFQEYFKESISFPTSEDQVVQLCRQYDIQNYFINPDLSIDVDGDVDLSDLKLSFGSILGTKTSLPLRFSIVVGSFYCNNNCLTTLEGGPREVRGHFVCFSNRLTTLEGGPREVGGHFSCHDNPVYEIIRKFPDHKKVLKFWDDFDVVRNRNELSAYRFEEMYLDLTGKEFRGYLEFEGYKVVE